MISIVAIHALPDDPEHFDHYYEDVHMPLVRAIPGVVGIRYGHVISHPKAQSGNYLICDTYFPDLQALDRALESPEMAAAMEDVPKFSTGGVTIFFSDVKDSIPAAAGARSR